MTDPAYTDADYYGEFNLLYAERELICKALIRTYGSATKSATILKMSDRNFIRKVKRHQLLSFINEVKEDRRKEIDIHREVIYGELKKLVKPALKKIQ